jgi:tRNA (guanine-N7-)-methyltransferase
MSSAQKRSYDPHSRWRIPFAREFLDNEKIFGGKNPVTVEIGFGMGEATALIAEGNPDKNYLGIEVHRPGVGKLLWEIEKRGLQNIRIIEHDAVEVLACMIAPASVHAFHIFFPDPWPKKKHHKRRLLTRPFTGLLAEKLVKGGYIYAVTDWEDYAEWILTEFAALPELVNPRAESLAPQSFAPHPPWRPQTKFERKGIAKNHKISELYFVRS